MTTLPASKSRTSSSLTDAQFYRDQLTNLGQQQYWRVLADQHPLSPILKDTLDAQSPVAFYIKNLAHSADIAHDRFAKMPFPQQTSFLDLYRQVGASMIWTRRAVDVLLSVYFPDLRLSETTLDKLPLAPEQPPVAHSLYKSLTQFNRLMRLGTASIREFDSAVDVPAPDWINKPIDRLSAEMTQELQTWLGKDQKQRGTMVRRNFLSACLSLSLWGSVSFISLCVLHAVSLSSSLLARPKSKSP
jgi:hypothetical protein